LEEMKKCGKNSKVNKDNKSPKKHSNYT
jgi:hypothetical protein